MDFRSSYYPAIPRSYGAKTNVSTGIFSSGFDTYGPILGCFVTVSSTRPSDDAIDGISRVSYL